MRLLDFETCSHCMRAHIVSGLKGHDPEIAKAAPGAIRAELQSRIELMIVPILEDGGLVLWGYGVMISPSKTL